MTAMSEFEFIYHFVSICIGDLQIAALWIVTICICAAIAYGTFLLVTPESWH
jgi:hypothetical protein